MEIELIDGPCKGQIINWPCFDHGHPFPYLDVVKLKPRPKHCPSGLLSETETFTTHPYVSELWREDSVEWYKFKYKN